MVSSRDVLSVLKPALDGLSAALAMLFGFLNMIFTPVERLFQMVLDLADRGMMFQWAVDLLSLIHISEPTRLRRVGVWGGGV